MNSTQILAKSEIDAVLRDLRRKAKRSRSTKLNLTVFTMVIGCGLRVSELCSLRLKDVLSEGERPCVYVRHGKGDKSRVIPLSWSKVALEQVQEWKAIRMTDGATSTAPFLTSTRTGSSKHLDRFTAAKRWRTAVKVLGRDRARQLNIHCGRHTFCSLALAAGRTLVEIKEAAGHSNISTTSIYLHTLDNPNAVDLYWELP